jgi:hypothetical protein
MSDTSTTTTDIWAEINNLKVKVGDLEARVTHLEGGFDFESVETSGTDDPSIPTP